MPGVEPPRLLHFRISHFNEKVRWGLDFKGIAHVREALRASMSGRAGFQWVLDIYRRHRGTSSEVVAQGECGKRKTAAA